MNYVGIDVSKATFVVAYSSAKSSETKTFENTTKGVHKFILTITPEDTHCVMEATGNYSMLLVYLLSKAGITIAFMSFAYIAFINLFFIRSIICVS